MLEYSGLINFRIDPLLSSDCKRHLESILYHYKSAQIQGLDLETSFKNDDCVIDFISETSIYQSLDLRYMKICLLDLNQGLFSYGQSFDESNVDGILDEKFDEVQLNYLIGPYLQSFITRKECELFELGSKNLKRIESLAKTSLTEVLQNGSEIIAHELLDYIQALINLEKDLIHSENLSRIEKDLKQFAKNHFIGEKINFILSQNFWKIMPGKNFLILPRYKGEFLGVDLKFDEDVDFLFYKKLFFIKTLIHFLNSSEDIEDPFASQKLWESSFDSIPFPMALLSSDGEVFQHNSLFSKLGLLPNECLKIKSKEKVLIGSIPYNIYRKDIFHLDEKKILFVFFTESIFLKGEGNLTPSGQELGIISSSIAHELNNPVAGIHAALSYLLLDEELDQEAKENLNEMKNGAIRCKQLIETFLGFSRASPTQNRSFDSKISPIEFCYQQAQNLLRFRTVESGIRFSFTYSKHTDFKSEVNISLLTMTYYLILGEMMTLYSHQMLVANKNQIEKVIRGEIIESSQEIQIQLTDLNISNLGLSKLIQNLLKIENFVLQMSDYSLRFISNPIIDA